MNRKTLTSLTILACIVVTISSCNKYNVQNEPATADGAGQMSGNTVSANIEGRITDQNGSPVNGAMVTAGTITTTTDINGKYQLSQVNVVQHSALIKVQKAGFFNGFRTIIVNPSSTNYATIELIPRSISGHFDSRNGGLIHANNGGTIRFSPDAIIVETTGKAYTGNVKVAAFFLDPNDASFFEYMPGDLRGITSGNEERGLQSFGMMVVELEGSNGEKLQVAPGKTATLNYPIANKLLSQAPATIPFWYFDEVEGMWKEEGFGIRQNGSYVSEVRHFTYWNADIPQSIVNLEATFRDQQQVPLAFAKVAIARANGDIRFGYTDASGHVYAMVPAGEELSLSINNECGASVYEQHLSKLNSDINLGIITVQINSPRVIISGKAVDCNGNFVKSGVMEIKLDGKTHKTNIVNGSFSINIPRCYNDQATAVLQAFDENASMLSNVFNLNVTEGSINAGTINICSSSVDEYITLSMDGQVYSWTTPDDIELDSGSGNSIRSAKQNNEQLLNFQFIGNKTGQFAASQFEFYPTIECENSYSQTNSPIAIRITEYGRYVKGTFSGNLILRGNNAAFPITGSFQLRKN